MLCDSGARFFIIDVDVIPFLKQIPECYDHSSRNTTGSGCWLYIRCDDLRCILEAYHGYHGVHVHVFFCLVVIASCYFFVMWVAQNKKNTYNPHNKN
jgi:hypothetical protein